MYSGVMPEIYEAARQVEAEVFYPDVTLADVRAAGRGFGLDVHSADLKLMIARAEALVWCRHFAEAGEPDERRVWTRIALAVRDAAKAETANDNDRAVTA